MQYLSPVTATDRYSLSTKLTGNISDKLSLIFSVFLPSKPQWQSCISWWNHVYIQYGGPNSIKICCICPLYHRPVPNSAKFSENIEIPQKWTNSAARLKIPCSAENCGPYFACYLSLLGDLCQSFILNGYSVCSYRLHKLWFWIRNWPHIATQYSSCCCSFSSCCCFCWGDLLRKV